MTPDVNVLVAAFRADHPQHRVARAWLEAAMLDAARGASLTLQPMVVTSFLRLVTSLRVFPDAAPVEKAVEFIDVLSSSAGVGQSLLGAEWPLLRELCVTRKLAANAIPDAWLAAAAIHQGEQVASFDAGLAQLLPRGRFVALLP